jgi:hypothetical protein
MGAPRGSGIVAERVERVVCEALRGEPTRWWDAEELTERVVEAAPGLSQDPGAYVRIILHRLRAEGADWLEWQRELRMSARARAMGGTRRGPPAFVCRWRQE